MGPGLWEGRDRAVLTLSPTGTYLTLFQMLKIIHLQPERNLVKFFSCFYYKHIILIGKTLNTSFTVIKSKHLSNIPKKILDKN